MSAERYIWVTRWADFQHYRPERDRAPAWLKSYTRQLDDERFLNLSMHARGVLDSVRIAFARAHGRLSTDTRQLTHRLGQRVTTVHLEGLADAGFIELVSRDVLDQRLEAFYSSPRARVEGEEESLDREKVALEKSNGRPVTGERRARTWIDNGLADEVPPDHLEDVLADEFGLEREQAAELVSYARRRAGG
jgi:hypothetical protein